MKIIKRNGAEVIFDRDKIVMAVTKANDAVEDKYRMTPLQIQRITENVQISCEQMGRSPSVEEIQDLVEKSIMAISDFSQLQEAYDYALAATNADHMVVEKFVEGQEIGIDAFVQNGKLLLMLPHDKYVYQSGHTGIPIGHYCPMDMSDKLYNNMLRETEKIIAATGMDNCAINIDAFVLPDESVSIIEAAGRCGATGIPEVISGFTGRNYYSCIIDNALGLEIAPFEAKSGRPTGSILLYSRQSGIVDEIRYAVDGREYINESVSIEGVAKVELSFFPGDDIDAFNNGTDRIGQAVFYAKSNEQLQKAVNDFRQSLKVKVKDQ